MEKRVKLGSQDHRVNQVHLEIPDFKDRTVKEERMVSKDDLDLMVNREREERKDQPDPLGPPDSRVNGDHKVKLADPVNPDRTESEARTVSQDHRAQPGPEASPDPLDLRVHQEPTENRGNVENRD